MPAEPRDAATLILLRDAPSKGGLQVLMVRRHVRSEFAADMNVFPGGAVEEGDITEGEIYFKEILREKSEMSQDLFLRLAAIRETFEETGILLAMFLQDDRACASCEIEAYSALREELRESGIGFTALLKKHGLRPAIERLIPFARWITPEAMPIRFDARFFLAEAPPHQEPLLDGVEISDCFWINPGEALRSCREGRFPMLPPTVANLRELASYASTAEALEAAGGRRIRPVTPRLVSEGKIVKLLLPGDPGYEG